MSDDMESVEDPATPFGTSTRGKLLVATPLLLDPNFYRSIVFMVEHTEEGAMGLVLNRPTDALVTDHLPEWEDLMPVDAVVFVGGPVANEVAVGLARAPSLAPSDWDPVFDEVGLVDLAAGSGVLGNVADVRVFSGYSGWSAGQLDAELLSGSWLVVPATVMDVFTREPEELWRRVLRRQKGTASVYASYPEDPSSN